ncbi:tetratricopeptide repeat protein [Engelhardtia mirabilis]|uniref:Tetratricopeptide repeat protein n=1 Tax=Engelhardtia mirabilis TaxID=2528011 RepID=A0A518BDE8_9BACT|nr:tetratricopeptide repeat protein [Planctomycetes bacterium Pla133]QDU99333.1 tetratricopeptide repeat protein [Planctomycetes bacterium Pla86]
MSNLEEIHPGRTLRTASGIRRSLRALAGASLLTGLGALCGGCMGPASRIAAQEDWHRAEMASARGDWVLAADLWNRLRHATYADRSRPHLETASALAELGREDDALALLDHAIELFPGDKRLLARRGRLLAAMGFRRAAELDLEEAVESAPDDPTVWAALGAVQLELDQPRRAAASFDRVIALDRAIPDGISEEGDPSDSNHPTWLGGIDRPAAYQLAARAQRELGDFLRAHELYALAIEYSAEPSNELLVEAASLHTDRDDDAGECPNLDQAVCWIELATERDPQCERAAFVLGCLLERQGRNEEAVVAYRRAVEIDNLHLGALTNLALLHERLGENTRCSAMAERALMLETDPHRREALERLLTTLPAGN